MSRSALPSHVQEKVDEALRGERKPEPWERPALRAYECMVKAPPLALGRLAEPYYRSELERDRADFLQRCAADGTIAWWMYEPCQLALGGGAKYKPDFLVMELDSSLTFEETKGFWRESHRVRIKVAAARFPIFRFHGITRDENGWKCEEFKP